MIQIRIFLASFTRFLKERENEFLILRQHSLRTEAVIIKYQPLTKKGNNEIGGNFSDDPLWMILSTAQYIKETGDYSILDEKVPYDNDETKAQTMMHHLKQSFWHVAENIGPHGLPLAMRADWNDCLNLSCFSDAPGESFQTYTSPKYGDDKFSHVAESVFVAALFAFTGPEYAALCRYKNLFDEAKAAESAIAEMNKNIMKHGYERGMVSQGI